MAEGTHFQKFGGRIRTDRPASPATGEVFYDSVNGSLMVWNGTVWIGVPMTTSTSTSTTTSTSTSTSTSTTTSTS